MSAVELYNSRALCTHTPYTTVKRFTFSWRMQAQLLAVPHTVTRVWSLGGWQVQNLPTVMHTEKAWMTCAIEAGDNVPSFLFKVHVRVWPNVNWFHCKFMVEAGLLLQNSDFISVHRVVVALCGLASAEFAQGTSWQDKSNLFRCDHKGPGDQAH